jgi:hypothetical protein
MKNGQYTPRNKKRQEMLMDTSGNGIYGRAQGITQKGNLVETKVGKLKRKIHENGGAQKGNSSTL